MRIFISHASKNKEVVFAFADFLRKLNSEIEVFCSSEDGSIPVGKNFIKTVFERLNESDVIIPILSKEYYESRFCMVELGIACSYLYNKYQKIEENYIFPFAVFPVRKGQALSGTPLLNIQAGDLTDKKDILNFLEYLRAEKGISLDDAIDGKLESLKTELEQILLKSQNVMELARLGTFFHEDGVFFEKREDIAHYSINEKEIIVNFNMNPYEMNRCKYPEFISLAMIYIDKLDLGRYLDFNDAAEFQFVLTNFTNSLKKVFVEFKYSDANKIWPPFEFELKAGENEVSIPLKSMPSKVLSEISEICFVIHPQDVSETEGMFKISGITVK